MTCVATGSDSILCSRYTTICIDTAMPPCHTTMHITVVATLLVDQPLSQVLVVDYGLEEDNLRRQSHDEAVTPNDDA